VFPNQAIIADHLAYNRAILLLHKALIVFQVRASPRERQVCLFAIADQHFIDELSSVVGIDSQNRKREERACALEGHQQRLLAAMHEGQTFRPAGCYVGERQREQVAVLDVGATMSYQVRFQKAGSSLLPLFKGADGDLLLEQGSCSRRGGTVLTSFALGTQQPIRRRRAHGEQLATALL